MEESNQEGYQTLGWIINKSEYGLYLVIADETIQKEIVEIYQKGKIGIYDYKQHQETYSFHNLKEWILSLPEIHTFFIVNFQFSIRSEQDLKRLNFSRDMIANLQKNLIFFTTPSEDDKLIVSAYDFYSFIKIRITFHDYKIEGINKKSELLSEKEAIQQQQVMEEQVLDKNRSKSIQEEKWCSEETREKLQATYDLIKQAKEAEDKKEYSESIRLLLESKEIREKLLGSEHLEMEIIYEKLGHLYEKQRLYKESENFYKKALKIHQKKIGRAHV